MANVSTDRSAYMLGQSIQISWAGLSADSASWVGYAPAGSADSTVTRWASASAQATGSLTLEGALTPGTYVARAFADATYIKAGESAVFVVQ
jgi:hypothetical protein